MFRICVEEEKEDDVAFESDNCTGCLLFVHS